MAMKWSCSGLAAFIMFLSVSLQRLHAAQPGTSTAQPGTSTAQPGTSTAQPGTNAAHPGISSQAFSKITVTIPHYLKISRLADNKRGAGFALTSNMPGLFIAEVRSLKSPSQVIRVSRIADKKEALGQLEEGIIVFSPE